VVFQPALPSSSRPPVAAVAGATAPAAPVAKPLARPRTEEDRIQLEPLGAATIFKPSLVFPQMQLQRKGGTRGELNPGWGMFGIWRFRKVELLFKGLSY